MLKEEFEKLPQTMQERLKTSWIDQAKLDNKILVKESDGNYIRVRLNFY